MKKKKNFCNPTPVNFFYFWFLCFIMVIAEKLNCSFFIILYLFYFKTTEKNLFFLFENVFSYTEEEKNLEFEKILNVKQRSTEYEKEKTREFLIEERKREERDVQKIDNLRYYELLSKEWFSETIMKSVKWEYKVAFRKNMTACCREDVEKIFEKVAEEKKKAGVRCNSAEMVVAVMFEVFLDFDADKIECLSPKYDYLFTNEGAAPLPELPKDAYIFTAIENIRKHKAIMRRERIRQKEKKKRKMERKKRRERDGWLWWLWKDEKNS